MVTGRVVCIIMMLFLKFFKKTGLDDCGEKVRSDNLFPKVIMLYSKHQWHAATPRLFAKTSFVVDT